MDLRVRRDEEEFDARIRLKAPQPEMAPAAFDRQARMNRMGSQVSQRAEGFAMAIQHDTVLQPWQCGGPVEPRRQGDWPQHCPGLAGRDMRPASRTGAANRRKSQGPVPGKDKARETPVSINAPASAGRQ